MPPLSRARRTRQLFAGSAPCPPLTQTGATGCSPTPSKRASPTSRRSYPEGSRGRHPPAAARAAPPAARPLPRASSSSSPPCPPPCPCPRFYLFTRTPRTHACPPLACNSPRTFGTRAASRSTHSAECRDVRGSSRNKILSHSDAGETPWRATCRFQCGRRPGKRLNSSGRARSQAARCTGSIAC